MKEITKNNPGKTISHNSHNLYNLKLANPIEEMNNPNSLKRKIQIKTIITILINPKIEKTREDLKTPNLDKNNHKANPDNPDKKAPNNKLLKISTTKMLLKIT